jgi:hypothetical protein
VFGAVGSGLLMGEFVLFACFHCEIDWESGKCIPWVMKFLFCDGFDVASWLSFFEFDACHGYFHSGLDVGFCVPFVEEECFIELEF